MIVSHFKEVRRFMGRLDPGQDIVAGFKSLCRENRVDSAWIMASAVLRNPSVAPLSSDGTGVDPTVQPQGPVFCPSISGNISQEGDGRTVRLYSACHPVGGGATVLGLVQGGEVLHCEFLLVALDDARLVRDGTGGLAPWVLVQSAEEPSPGPQQPEPAKPAFPPLRTATYEDEESELHILEIQVGDFLDHPRFGECRVVHAPVDDRVTVKLPTGKHVDLHLGVMRVMPPKQVGSRRVFQIEVRRRT